MVVITNRCIQFCQLHDEYSEGYAILPLAKSTLFAAEAANPRSPWFECACWRIAREHSFPIPFGKPVIDMTLRL